MRSHLFAILFSFSCISTAHAVEKRLALQFFETKIRPILVRHCYKCHSHNTAKPKGGLRLDWRPGLRKGGESGPAVIPGKAGKSLLIVALKHESLAMPPNKRLPDAVIADFVKWINDGAMDPRDKPGKADKSVWNRIYQQRLKWWSLQPVVRPRVPTASRMRWSTHPIDRFIAARLSKQGLRPAAAADRRTIARRLSYVLIGLPPDPRQMDSFVHDPSPTAYERLVDRLLSSPHFGERWARHWMDVVRYTDTYGYEWDVPAKGSWRYRDYLTRALNGDVPYDQLVREQIAGDLLKKPRVNSVKKINESVIGPMFYQMGEKRHGDSGQFNGIHQEMLDNKIDAFSKAFQATTVACARCHDHKLDAIAQREYYALGGMFMSSRWVTNTADLPQRHERLLQQLKNIKKKLRPLLAAGWLKELRRPDSALATRLSKASSENPAKDQFADLLQPWIQTNRKISTKKNLTTAWKEVADSYLGEMKRRAGQNAAHFKFAVDFRQGIPAGWSVDGIGLSEIVKCGDFVVALGGSQIVDQLLPGGLFTHVLSSKLNGALRSPYLSQFNNGHISFECAGGDHAAHRTVVDNAFLTERQQYILHKDLSWTLMWTLKQLKGRQNFIEFVTKASNPNFPPRVGLSGVRLTKRQIDNPRSWFGVTRVALHEVGFPPLDDLARFAPLFKLGSPTNRQELLQTYRQWFVMAVKAWSRNQAGGNEIRLINWLLSKQLLPNQLQANPQVGSLVRRYRKIEDKIEVPWTIHGMNDDNPGYNYRLNIRGDYDNLGAAIPRGYLACIGSGPAKSRGSGRLELAKVIADAKNPLTARVYVNRVWQWLFGAGLVLTPNDFGHLGARPTHPQLLDFLAARFVEEGWSVKRLVRSIVLSQTWRQSGRAARLSLNKDPANRLWHHYPLRRLEAEAIRDAMLTVSGRLDRRMFGRPTNPHRANEDAEKRLFSGPLDGLGRRAIYTKITIMEPPRFLSTFNQPEPKIPTGKRDVTNTPTQSLALLNDPFVLGQAKVWAQRVVSGEKSTANRLKMMFRDAFGRPANKAEILRWSVAVRDMAKLHRCKAADVKVWQDIAHALLNTKEFIYIR